MDCPIIGVVDDTRELGLDVDPEPTVFFCGLNASGTLLMRAAGDPQDMAGRVRREVSNLDPGANHIYDVQTMRNALIRPLGRRRLTARLFAGMAMVSAALAGLGVLGSRPSL